MEIGFVSLILVFAVLRFHKAKSSNMENESLPSYLHRAVLAMSGVFSIIAGISFTVKALETLQGQSGVLNEDKLLGIIGIIGGPIISMFGLAMVICGSFMAISAVKGWLRHIHNPQRVQL